MKKKCLNGVITALVTPFTKNDKIDYISFEKLLLNQINANIDGVVLFGTTGEGISLKDHEKKSLLLLAKNTIKEKFPILAGISSPTTDGALKQAEFYTKLGIKNLLVSTPFYYKTTIDGVYKHFTKILENCNCNIMIYNVPARTNCDISLMPQILKTLEDNQQIIGIKHAGLTLENSLSLLNKTKLPLFCGNDKYFYTLVKNGYKGVISVFSNIIPQTAKELYHLICLNRWRECEKILEEINPLWNALENEPNPIPIKYAVSLFSEMQDVLRLPLTKANNETKEQINNFFNSYSVKL